MITILSFISQDYIKSDKDNDHLKTISLFSSIKTSILSQTFTNWELLLVTNVQNVSFESSMKENIDPRIKIIYTPDSYFNLNSLYEIDDKLYNSKYKYISIFDLEHDLWNINKLQFQYEIMDVNNYDIIGCECSPSNECIDFNNTRIIKTPQLSLFNSCPFLVSTILIKKELFQNFYSDAGRGRQAPPPDPLCERRGCGGTTFPQGQGDFDKIVKTYASTDSLYYYPGVMFRTFSGERFKLRNPNYEMVKNTKGLSARSEFVYLHLKQLCYVRKHFERCPEDELNFFEFQSNLYNYTSSLHKNYLDCYIYKNMALKAFPIKYRNNMYKLHNDYLHVLKPEGKRVTLSHVVQFVNNLSVPSQIYFLNQKESTEILETSETIETIETPIVPKKIFSSPPLTPLTLQLTPEYSPLEMKCPNAP